MKRPFRAVCLVAWGVAWCSAQGHHASNLVYDAERIGTIEGVVADVFWANPHIHVYLTVTTADGATEIWDMEGPNLASLRRQGVSRERIRVGETLLVTGTLGRDGTRRIWAEAIAKPDGTLVMGERP